MIRNAELDDAKFIAEIYNYYIQNTIVTFEEELVTASSVSERIGELKALNLPWLVAEDKGEVVGYAYASKWGGRCAYRHSVEATVYLNHNLQSKGWGTKLYSALFETLKERSVHVVIGGISLPNDASVALHEKFGMEKVAHFKEVGFKFGEWVDVGYWQFMLDSY